MLEFDSPEQETRFEELLEELRCMVCQNQTLADSNARLARDLRERTYNMVRSGKSNNEIIEHMVERFGDFVLYRPPLKKTTVLLWFGPAIFLIIAVSTFWLYSHRTRRRPISDLSPVEREKAQRLLDE
ncbi:Cytochrome c-type biogenesis protein CcmH [Geodia barretti]|uniref:Cytochrome c-type biogenesis CcmH-like mitochondrial protein n=2 Tax=Geodia barretti TaxID=519541 RepID=A0AA35SZB0_GEOBA|nr:Cytochrome c-type biogenesis protein CcmH [Geodia barretti]